MVPGPLSHKTVFEKMRGFNLAWLITSLIPSIFSSTSPFSMQLLQFDAHEKQDILKHYLLILMAVKNFLTTELSSVPMSLPEWLITKATPIILNLYYFIISSISSKTKETDVSESSSSVSITYKGSLSAVRLWEGSARYSLGMQCALFKPGNSRNRDCGGKSQSPFWDNERSHERNISASPFFQQRSSTFCLNYDFQAAFVYFRKKILQK